MSGRKWSLSILLFYTGLLLLVGGSVIIIDPFFHFHAPLEGVSYQQGSDQYINDGIAKHFEYNAVITGSSMSQGFETSEADALFGVKSVNLTYLGEGFKKTGDIVDVAISYHPEIKLVIRSIDPLWFVSDVDWQGHEDYPEYLYDDNIWNDTDYLFNREVFANEVIPVIIRTAQGLPAARFDQYAYRLSGGKEAVLAKYERPEKMNTIPDEAETQEYFNMLERNLQGNVIHTIKTNPEIEFYLFLPPYSICWWDDLHQRGVEIMKRRLAMEEYVIEKLLLYENVRLFSFFNHYSLICDLNNYVDSVHYASTVSSDILRWMKNGQYELTEENYQEYIREITTFYSNYDYDSIFQ